MYTGSPAGRKDRGYYGVCTSQINIFVFNSSNRDFFFPFFFQTPIYHLASPQPDIGNIYANHFYFEYYNVWGSDSYKITFICYFTWTCQT